jgi:predicted ribosomally synthesized peptide with nif11-like leader
MSSKALSAFLAKAKEDQELRGRIEAIETADKENAIAELVKVGADAGFEFTADDVNAEEEADVAGQSGDGQTEDVEDYCLWHDKPDGTQCLCFIS